MAESHPLDAVSRAVAVLGAAYLTAGSLQIASDPGATAARYALLAAVVALAWLGVAGVVGERRRRWAVALVGLTGLGLLNPLLSRFLLPAAAALGVAVLLSRRR